MTARRRIVTVVGARPQFVKAGVVSHALREDGAIDEVLVHTGQHFDANMSDVFFEELGMAPPAYDLAISGGRHGEMTGRMLGAIESVLVEQKPDALLVYGDTNSTLAGALAAVKLHIPVAHVEAGLRSFNLAMPEEINRIVTDRISRWLYTPTTVAEAHLRREGIDQGAIVPVGDVMFDVARFHGARVGAHGGALERLQLTPGDYVLATVHRAENTDHAARLAAVVDALEQVAVRHPVVWPLHPRTRQILERAGRLATLPPAVRIVEPLGYLDMVQLEKHALVIATDSGGVQKEAFFHGVPCVTLRDETEWVELVEAGWNRLAPPGTTDAAGLAAAVLGAVGSRGHDVQPYGKGDASRRIARHLREALWT